ncbi:MAG TPA: histidinol-phosphate transaminase [bacterium]|nr:histidinol-phosphate transaminase [bacterium]
MSWIPSMSVKARPEIELLTAYRLPQTADVKLNQNESPDDWPVELKADVLRELERLPWNRYPPVDARPLREALAAVVGVSPGMVAATNGSNEALLALVQAFASGRTVVTTVPGYSMVPVLAVVGGARVQQVRLRQDFSLDVEAMRAAVARPEAALTVIASPNNPTGNRFDSLGIEAVLDAAAGLVVVDEAYGDFVDESFVSDVRSRPNLAVVRTFSKAFGLAGVRVGWIIGSETVIAAVGKALPPYNLSLFAQETARAALRRPDLMSARVQRIVDERRRIEGGLRALAGVEVFPTETNFALFRTPYSAAGVFEALLHRGVLVRDVSRVPLLDRCLRVTVGTPRENDCFLDALGAALEETR